LYVALGHLRVSATSTIFLLGFFMIFFTTRTGCINVSTFFSLLAIFAFTGCSDDKAQPPSTANNKEGSAVLGINAGGPVAGPIDAHCGVKNQKTNLLVCHDSTQPHSVSFFPHSDLQPLHTRKGENGAEEQNDEHEAANGETLYNADGNDDDCKYRVSFTVTTLLQNEDSIFTVTLATRLDNTPVVNATPRIEAYLNETHPALYVAQATPVELSSGTYTLGPVKFDASGRWTVRFHFFEQCSDLTPESPHGRVAFFVDVP